MKNIDIQGFLNKTADSNIFSVVIRSHGDIVLEHHERGNVLRPIYSATKSFTSTAVGIAVDEGLITLDDKVVSFFTEAEVPANPSERLTNLNIRDLLKMAMGHMNGYLMQDDSWGTEPRSYVSEKNWVKYCFEKPLAYNPGEKFIYDNSCAYILGVIVQKVSGQSLEEYLNERLFKPLEIEEFKWEKCPMGYNFGAGGMFLKTVDFSKLGQLYLNKGMWNGKQIISEEWIKEATRKQISTEKPGDWGQGYGYQFWIGTHDSYRADGKFGQYVIVLPKKDAVITIMAHALHVRGIMSAVWDELYHQL